MASVNELFQQLGDRIQQNPAKLQGMNGSYQFELTGDGGGTYHLDLQNGSADLGEGALAAPGCTITLAAQDFLDMVSGKANPTSLFFGGRLKIGGDMGLAMKLQSILM